MKTMTRAALLCCFAVAVYSGAPIDDSAEDPKPCTEQILGTDSKICCEDQAAYDLAGDSGNCGFTCIDKYQLNADEDACEPRPCPQETDVANAEATGSNMAETDCSWECLPDYELNQAEDGCDPLPCETAVANAEATGGLKKDQNCGFECVTNWIKSPDELSCVAEPCSTRVENAEATGFLKDNDCGFECDEDYLKNEDGDGCEPKPCTTSLENALATGTNEALDDCGYKCKEGFAKHKTNGVCEAKSENEMKSKAGGPSGGKLGDGEPEPTEPVAKKSPAAKMMITFVAWIALLGAPLL